jgi:hypothetical protein
MHYNDGACFAEVLLGKQIVDLPGKLVLRSAGILFHSGKRFLAERLFNLGGTGTSRKGWQEREARDKGEAALDHRRITRLQESAWQW